MEKERESRWVGRQRVSRKSLEKGNWSRLFLKTVWPHVGLVFKRWDSRPGARVRQVNEVLDPKWGKPW